MSERPNSPDKEPGCSNAAFSPEATKPHPKAPEREKPFKSNSRKRRKTRVLTDTPEKEAFLIPNSLSV